MDDVGKRVGEGIKAEKQPQSDASIMVVDTHWSKPRHALEVQASESPDRLSSPCRKKRVSNGKRDFVGGAEEVKESPCLRDPLPLLVS